MAERGDSGAAAADGRRPVAPLHEVFCSVQGEGRFVGEGMVFVRVATCPIRCRYCDTPQAYTASREFVWEGGVEANPVRGDRAAELVMQVAANSAFGGQRPLRVSVTGGEPLVFPGFVLALGTALGCDARIHLETAALDAVALGVALPVLDHVSADYKLPGTLAADDGDPRAAHRNCLDVLRAAGSAGPTVDVKLVLTDDVAVHDLRLACADLAAGGDDWHQRLEIVLQPVTPTGGIARPVSAALVEAAARAATAHGLRYRVLPQVHKQLGMR